MQQPESLNFIQWFSFFCHWIYLEILKQSKKY